MLIASSPVEIEAKAGEAALSQEAHDAALRLFHALTDRVGQAAATLGTPHDEWPKHRFYFGTAGDLSALLSGLAARPDILDVSQAIPPAPAPCAGLFAQAKEAAFLGVLVAHESHEGYRA